MQNIVRHINGRLGGNYRKSLIAILLIASFPGIVTGSILFIVSKQQIENELQQVHHNQLKQTVGTIDDQFSFLERSMAHWAFDPQFTGSLRNLDFAYDYKEIHDIYRTLLIMEGSNPLIERVELFLNEPVALSSRRICTVRSIVMNSKRMAAYWSITGPYSGRIPSWNAQRSINSRPPLSA
ncbi:hypothetical protein ACFOHW_00035 [Paenibacillus abyssi]|uniref:hypothetical protein n=1 Tax=Paenibacillus abyssi TaxID=1340531 RepID=UPI00361FE697